ncbi:hypothetical protein [Rhizobium sp. BK251]|uniref:hypothetical protein n=1 Tax=Rhizobium sp. BK251 TaxID=2512125 RepID=UPI00104DFCE8|nr:hypothetical protein [Rhizobium sp. BK251]
MSTVRQTFEFGEFIFLVLMTLMLFATAALLLPSRGEDEAQGMRVYFEQDGRFALISLTVFLLFGLVVNAFGLKSPIGLEAPNWQDRDTRLLSAQGNKRPAPELWSVRTKNPARPRGSE